MRIYAGVDIGGTTIKVGVMSDKLDKITFATPHSADELIDKITDAIKELSSGELCGIGVGCPGAVDRRGVIDYMPNIDIFDLDIATLLSKRLNTVVCVTNDANAAALGECRRLGLSDAVMLTLGTGVGSGIVIDGKIFEGYCGKAAEIGHMIIEAGGRKCGCGLNGCFEAYASSSALIAQTKEAMKKNSHSLMWKLCSDINEVSGALAFDAERLGDETATFVIKEYVGFLSIGILNICNIFRPQAIIIGGGVSNQDENLIGRVRSECEKLNYGYKKAPHPLILRASLGDNAGLYGAIEFIKDKVEENI